MLLQNSLKLRPSKSDCVGPPCTAAIWDPERERLPSWSPDIERGMGTASSLLKAGLGRYRKGLYSGAYKTGRSS